MDDLYCRRHSAPWCSAVPPEQSSPTVLLLRWKVEIRYFTVLSKTFTHNCHYRDRKTTQDMLQESWYYLTVHWGCEWIVQKILKLLCCFFLRLVVRLRVPVDHTLKCPWTRRWHLVVMVSSMCSWNNKFQKDIQKVVLTSDATL